MSEMQQNILDDMERRARELDFAHMFLTSARYQCYESYKETPCKEIEERTRLAAACCRMKEAIEETNLVLQLMQARIQNLKANANR